MTGREQVAHAGDSSCGVAAQQRGPAGNPMEPAAHPNAAKLFLNWNLSDEGQTFMIKELGQLTSLKQAPAYPEGYDPKVVKVWVPNFEQYKKLHAAWMDDWNKTYGYRQ